MAFSTAKGGGRARPAPATPGVDGATVPGVEAAGVEAAVEPPELGQWRAFQQVLAMFSGDFTLFLDHFYGESEFVW